MSVSRRVVERPNDISSVLQRSGDYPSVVFGPLSAYLFETMRVHPSSNNAFVLYISHLGCPCEQMVGEHYDIFVIVFARVVIFSSRQRICSAVILSL